jgi:CelD/BcsL family acetyltransferase involved in cellulose biosynthesis
MRDDFPFWLGGSDLSTAPRRVYRNIRRANLRLAPPADTVSALAERVSLNLEVEALDPAAARAHVADWNDLIARALEANAYYDPGFALAAAQHVTDRVRFLFVWGAGRGAAERELVGVCPLHTGTRLPGFAFAKGWTHKQAALGTPLLDQRRAAQALDAIVTFCRRIMPGVCGLMFPMLPLDGKTASLLRAKARRFGAEIHVLGGHERAILSHGVDPTAFFGQSVSQKRMRKLQRARHRLATQDHLAFRIAENAEDVHIATELFLSLEAKGWKGRRGTALLNAPQLATFTRTLTRNLANENRIGIASLELAGIPIAMAILLRCGAYSYIWKITYDEEFAQHSPGVQLMLEVTSAQLGDKSTRMTDSCAVADHPMIDHLWPERMSIGDVYLPLGSDRAEAFAGALAREKLRRNVLVELRRLANRFRPGKAS